MKLGHVAVSIVFLCFAFETFRLCLLAAFHRGGERCTRNSGSDFCKSQTQRRRWFTFSRILIKQRASLSLTARQGLWQRSPSSAFSHLSALEYSSGHVFLPASYPAKKKGGDLRAKCKTKAAPGKTHPPGKPSSPSKRICICGRRRKLLHIHTLFVFNQTCTNGKVWVGRSKRTCTDSVLTSMMCLKGNLPNRALSVSQ